MCFAMYFKFKNTYICIYKDIDVWYLLINRSYNYRFIWPQYDAVTSIIKYIALYAILFLFHSSIACESVLQIRSIMEQLV